MFHVQQKGEITQYLHLLTTKFSTRFAFSLVYNNLVKT